MFLINYWLLLSDIVLNIFDLTREHTCITGNLVAQNFKFIFVVFLQEKIILIENFHCFMDLKYLSALDIFKVNLPFAVVIVHAFNLFFQIWYLTFREEFKSAHYFFKPRYFFVHCFICEPCVFQWRLLYSVDFWKGISDSHFNCYLTRFDSFSDLYHLLHTFLNWIISNLRNLFNTNLLLVLDCFDYISDTAQTVLKLEHGPFFSL